MKEVDYPLVTRARGGLASRTAQSSAPTQNYITATANILVWEAQYQA